MGTLAEAFHMKCVDFAPTVDNRATVAPSVVRSVAARLFMARSSADEATPDGASVCMAAALHSQTNGCGCGASSRALHRLGRCRALRRFRSTEALVRPWASRTAATGC